MTSPETWKKLAIDAYHMLTLVDTLRRPPHFFNWPNGYTQNLLNRLETAVRQEGLDKYVIEARLTHLSPYCDQCGKFECIVGRDCCDKALDAGVKWERRKK